jgi:Skp family chaperone for outer membrane proteins
MDTKKAEVLAPIKAKLQAAIDSVSTQGDYMLVLDISSTPVAFKSAKVVDITAEVKTALGIAK